MARTSLLLAILCSGVLLIWSDTTLSSVAMYVGLCLSIPRGERLLLKERNCGLRGCQSFVRAIRREDDPEYLAASSRSHNFLF